MFSFIKDALGDSSSSSSSSSWDDYYYKDKKHKKGNKGKKGRHDHGHQQHAPPPQGPPPQQFGQHTQICYQQSQPYQQRYSHYNEQSQVYGTYGNNLQQNVFTINPWSAFKMQTEVDLQNTYGRYYNQNLNGIQAQELHCLMNTEQLIRNYYGINWSMELCKIMIMMLDRNKDGIMQYEEFKELLQCLLHWHQLFKTCADTNNSGYVEANELLNIIMMKFGYKLSQKAVETLLKRYSRAMDDGQCLIAFDDFVALSVRLRAYTEAFRARDRANHNGQETGTTTYGYDDFIQCVMCL